jgi:hypothetical protein
VSYFDSLVPKAVAHHTDLRSIFLDVHRWLKLRCSSRTAPFDPRDRGSPQGWAIRGETPPRRLNQEFQSTQRTAISRRPEIEAEAQWDAVRVAGFRSPRSFVGSR